MFSETYLYNPWTEIVHGHARSELNIVKQVESKRFTNVSILSFARDFGDLHINLPEVKYLKIPKIINRGVIFNYSVNKSEKLRNNLLREFLRNNSNDEEKQLIISSARTGHLWGIDDIHLNRYSVKIRLIHPPSKANEIVMLRETARKSNIRLSVETSDGQSYLDRLGIKNTLLVPPIQGLASVNLNPYRDKVGVYWPVSFSESEANLKNILDKLKHFDCIVRLPGNLDNEDSRYQYPAFKFIDRGISDDEFNNYIGETRIAILPHRGYKLRGSGLAAILAGCGIPILSYANNSFFDDINRHAVIEDLSKYTEDHASINNRIEQELTNPSNNSGYRSWTEHSWEKFLNNE